MEGSNILLVDNCKTYIENTVNAFSDIGIQSTLYFAENDMKHGHCFKGIINYPHFPKLC